MLVLIHTYVLVCCPAVRCVVLSKARVGFPMDRLAPSAARQLYTQNFHFPSSLECVEVLYDKLFIQVTHFYGQHH